MQQKIDSHEERIIRLEQSDAELKAQIDSLAETLEDLNGDLKEKYTRIEESNKYLREHTSGLAQQNERLYSAVIEGNNQSAKRSDEMKKQRQQDRTKIWVSFFGAGGGAIVIAKLIFDFVMSMQYK